MSKQLSKEYRDYLQTQHWQELREAVLNDERGRKRACVACYSPDNVQAHHLIYRKLYDCIPSDLVPLCGECHEILHQSKDSGEFNAVSIARIPPSNRAKTVAGIVASAKLARGYNLPSRDSSVEFNRVRLNPQKKSSRWMAYGDYKRKMV